ncbi:MAG: hypothetical protein AAF577_05460 [Pseudomonadota bacterium]
MAEQRQRVDLRLGDFACSIEGFEAPETVLKRILLTLSDEASRLPALGDSASRLDGATRARLIAEAARVANMPADRLEVLPGLIVTAKAAAEDAETPVAAQVERATVEDIRGALADAETGPSLEAEVETAESERPRRAGGDGRRRGWSFASVFAMPDERARAEQVAKREAEVERPAIDDSVALDDAIEEVDAPDLVGAPAEDAPAFTARPLIDETEENAEVLRTLRDRMAEASDTLGPIRPPLPASLQDETEHEENAQSDAVDSARAAGADDETTGGMPPTAADELAADAAFETGSDTGVDAGVDDLTGIADTPRPDDSPVDDVTSALEAPAEASPWQASSETAIPMDVDRGLTIDPPVVADDEDEPLSLSAAEEASGDDAMMASPEAGESPMADDSEPVVAQKARWGAMLGHDEAEVPVAPTDAGDGDDAAEAAETPAMLLGEEVEHPEELAWARLGSAGPDHDDATGEIRDADGAAVADMPIIALHDGQQATEEDAEPVFALGTEPASADPAGRDPVKDGLVRDDVVHDHGVHDGGAQGDPANLDDEPLTLAPVAAKDDGAEDESGGDEDLLLLTPVDGTDPSVTIGPDGKPRRRRRRQGGSIFGARARRPMVGGDTVALFRPFAERTEKTRDYTDGVEVLPEADPVSDDARVASTRMTAQELSWKMEAHTPDDQLICAAAYLTFAENAPRFSRRAVLDVLDGIPGEVVRNLEVRIKNFGKLVRDGLIIEIDSDTYELSPEQKARAARHFEE